MSVEVCVSPEIQQAWPAYDAAGLERAADDPRIAAWRSAFSEFGSKPSRVGGEDLDELRGNLRLVRAEDGEVVWRDDEGVTCRRWNWRQEPRTRLTEATRRAFFAFDGLPPQQALGAAVHELIEHLRARSPDAGIEVRRPTSAPS
jgi:DNA/RNA-binding domain of Phe-tRNA-synthetase-like protein